MKKEIRIAQIEIKAENENEMILEGYAATFEQPTILYEIDGVEYKEVIDRNAFANTDMKDCCLKYNHQDSIPILARSRGGSLELRPDEHGLFFRAKLLSTSIARDVYLLAKEGILDKCSFAFTVDENGDEYDKEAHTRRIRSIKKLWDCSIVDVPAYDSTSLNARDYFTAQKEQIELIEKEKRRKKLELLATL